MHIVFPDYYEDEGDQFIVESKGWLSDVVVHLSEGSRTFTFFDPVRLRQDIEATLCLECCWDEGHIVVIPSVTKANIERAIAHMFPRG